MTVRIVPGGWIDDSAPNPKPSLGLRPFGLSNTDPPWGGLSGQPEVDIPGQYQGQGQGFGPTGVEPEPPPEVPGTSLVTRGANTLRSFFGTPHTDATGASEMLTGPGGLVEKTRGQLNPWGFIGRSHPYWRGAIAGAGIISPTPTAPPSKDELNLPMITGRPDAPMSSVHGLPASAAAPQHGMPWPDTGVAPPAAPQRGMPWAGNNAGAPAGPAAAPAPAAPNLGYYTTFDRPNMSPQNSAYGHQGATGMGMLDLSHLFGGGQPAPAAAAPVNPPPPRPLVANQPSIRSVLSDPGPDDPSIIARQKIRRHKGSSTSQGGGFNQ